jgi:hypothetical protein
VLLSWEDIAMQELRRRQQSEAENHELRESVKRHLQQAQSSQRLLKRRLRAATLHSAPIAQPSRGGGLGSARLLSYGSVFRDLVAGTDAFYLDVDAFFEAIKMHELPCPGRRSDTDKNKVSADLLDCHEVPFDLRETAKAAWELRSSAAGTSNIPAVASVQVR